MNTQDLGLRLPTLKFYFKIPKLRQGLSFTEPKLESLDLYANPVKTQVVQQILTYDMSMIKF